MRKITLFVEDTGHETVLRTLLSRLAGEYGVEIEIKGANVHGGHGKAISQLKQYVRNLQRGQVNTPDLFIVAIDANCKGYLECRQKIEDQVGAFPAILGLTQLLPPGPQGPGRRPVESLVNEAPGGVSAP